jgi:hypothetical protein
MSSYNLGKVNAAIGYLKVTIPNIVGGAFIRVKSVKYGIEKVVTVFITNTNTNTSQASYSNEFMRPEFENMNFTSEFNNSAFEV